VKHAPITPEPRPVWWLTPDEIEGMQTAAGLNCDCEWAVKAVRRIAPKEPDHAD
jgi:hypothetical protein